MTSTTHRPGRRLASHGASPKIALVYVTGTYPLLTTTFVDRELDLLRRLGADVRVVAARRPPAPTRLSRRMADRERATTYLLPVSWPRFLAAHGHFALRRTRVYVDTLASLVSGRHPDLRSRVKTVAHFAMGVYAAYLIRTRPFAEIHAHFADRAATIALVASRLIGTPYSLSVHAAADIFVKPVLLREKVRAARRVVTCTEQNRLHLSSVTQTPVDAITTILHGLDLAEYPAQPQRSEEDPPLILSVAQLTERKGLWTLVLACSELRARGYRFRCEIVGRGRQEAELAALIRRHSLEDRVVLCGPLPHEQVVARYRRATVFALPCRTGPDGDVDGIPNVLAEAMASGVPVVSTGLPAIRELITDRVDGLLVRPDDPGGLAERIGELLDDPRLRAELAIRSRRTVEEVFDADANVRRLAATLWPDVFASEASDA